MANNNTCAKEFTGVTEICPTGDVIFVLGPERKKVLVSSTILQNASKYFKALLGPHFSEGQEVTNNVLKEIPMPEDDAQALEIIFNVIHFRNELVPHSPSPALIFKIAIAADKFDCFVALRYASAVWLTPETAMDGQERSLLMTAACIFDNAQAFSDITRWFLFHYKGSFATLLDNVPDEWIPSRTMILLEERRTRMRDLWKQSILDGITKAGIEDPLLCDCGWCARHCLAYLAWMKWLPLKPSQMSDQSISDLINKLKLMEDPNVPRSKVHCEYLGHSDPEYRAFHRRTLEALKKAKGLCLDCVRTSSGRNKDTCRIQH